MIADEKDEISGHMRLEKVVTRPASDAVLFTNSTCGAPSDALIFKRGVRGVLVCLFSRKLLKILTLNHNFFLRLQARNRH